MSHSMILRVYYEDTDLAGIVYYANYLKFIERGRSEWLRALGIDQAALKRQAGLVFAVRRIDMLSAARIVMDQTVTRDGEVLFAARVTIACLDARGRPTRLPAPLAAILRKADD